MSEVVRAYYNGKAEDEWTRLERPYRRFELLSTLRLVDKFFPSTGRIADIGSGPGRYAVELLRRGYAVTLVDLSEQSIAFAQRKLAELGVHAEASYAIDACNLSPLPDGLFDAALHLGPMYHIIDPARRRRALAELFRVLKPGAPAIVGFINPWGVLRSGLTEFPDEYHDESHIRQLLQTYIQAGEQDAFTEAAFVAPPQALDELVAAGFIVKCRAGVEGFASGALGPVATLHENDPSAYATVARLVAETATHPAYRDCTEHLHVVVRKPR